MAADDGLVLWAECVSCKATRDIKAGEVPAGDVPICQACGSPMVAKRAVVERSKRRLPRGR